MTFPYHKEPDGDRFAPHHLLWASYGTFLLALHASVTSEFQTVILSGLTVALFGFIHMWYIYPKMGALTTMGGLTLVTMGVLWHPISIYSLCLLSGCIVAWDDVLQHAFGLPMPIDVVWKKYVSTYVA